mmetsp:Transcript_18643/g.42906  ORF Transcript_18643/g.42906 Transcript_18643/m.42906 type:complete len:324 (+) Transcript_18643:1171-2142(+)
MKIRLDPFDFFFRLGEVVDQLLGLGFLLLHLLLELSQCGLEDDLVFLKNRDAAVQLVDDVVPGLYHFRNRRVVLLQGSNGGLEFVDICSLRLQGSQESGLGHFKGILAHLLVVPLGLAAAAAAATESHQSKHPRNQTALVGILGEGRLFSSLLRDAQVFHGNGQVFRFGHLLFDGLLQFRQPFLVVLVSLAPLVAALLPFFQIFLQGENSRSECGAIDLVLDQQVAIVRGPGLDIDDPFGENVELVLVQHLPLFQRECGGREIVELRHEGIFTRQRLAELLLQVVQIGFVLLLLFGCVVRRLWCGASAVRVVIRLLLLLLLFL